MIAPTAVKIGDLVYWKIFGTTTYYGVVRKIEADNPYSVKYWGAWGTTIEEAIQKQNYDSYDWSYVYNPKLVYCPKSKEL